MAPFARLSDKVEARARQAADRARHAIESAIAEFPEVMLRREGHILILSGPGLVRRWIGDMRLRFAFWRRG
jgi:hypothetical protein